MGPRRLAVLNDVHIGTIRTAGTTPASAMALREYLLQNFEDRLANIDSDLLINGDLFDKEVIPLRDLFATLRLLNAWLTKGHKLWLAPGNHDLSKTSTTYSSFQFLANFLAGLAPTQVTYIPDLLEIYPGHWVLPHLPNQDLLNDRLAKVPECEVLYVHTNFDNNFAAQSDNSLNISRDQAAACKAKFIVFGHEHQTRTQLKGKVVIPGNQVPSSVSDCQHCDDDAKFMVVVETDKPVLHRVLDLPYAEMDWQALTPTDARFIRVAGKATPDQGAEVAQAISRYRSAPPAFVITNAVQMQTVEGELAQFADSLESVHAFDVLEALYELLDEEEVKALKELQNA